MPAIFHRAAFEAVCKDQPKILRKLRPEQFDTYSGLEEALGWLTPRQRCDAIYAAWLLSLNGPDSGVLIQVRNRLLREGGLSANYLAEFAQNADDAHRTGFGGECHIWTREGWLFVSNNGRRFTGNDLHGLCRFFANGTKIAETEETIGKFGIGFKSCYRIGTEVFVHTWDDAGGFGFRVPLCRAGIEDSHYDRETFDRLVGALRLTNPRTSQDDLGYCTPEYRESWPETVANAFNQARSAFPTRGSVFAVHLHPRGMEALQERLHDQRKQIFELCPLFLRHLRVTRLEDTTLRLVQHDTAAESSIEGIVLAQRVTLEAQTGNDNKSNARFWRLTQSRHDKPWQMALHADSAFRLNFRPETGETTSLRDGSAYAFFPLGISWPFRLHLHLDLVTNLDRSNWSTEHPEEIQSRIVHAADALGCWLEAQRGLWHDDWNVASLVDRAPTQPLPGQTMELPAWWLFEALADQVQKRPLLRTLSGRFSRADGVRKVDVRTGEVFATAWRRLAELQASVWEKHPLVAQSEARPWKIPAARSEQLVSLARESIAAANQSDQAVQVASSVFAAFVGVRVESRALLDEVLKVVPIDDTGRSVAKLFNTVGGATLDAVWHQTFEKLARALEDDPFGNYVFGVRSLVDQCRRFSRPGFNPAWSSVPSVMHADLPWQKWDEFWGNNREPCPPELADAVLDVLRVQVLDQSRHLVLTAWLPTSGVPQAFQRDLGQALSARREEYVERLMQWNLWDRYQARLAQNIEASLLKRLSNEVDVAVGGNTLTQWLTSAINSQVGLERLGLLWTAVFEKPLVAALEETLGGYLRQYEKMSVLSVSIDIASRKVATILTGYREGPVWLTDSVASTLKRLRAVRVLEAVDLVTETRFRERMPEIARELLRVFWTWKDTQFDETRLSALKRIFGSLPKTERKAVVVGVGPRTMRPLSEFIVWESFSMDPNTHWISQAQSMKELFLPPALSRMSDLAEVCIRVSDLKVRCEGLPDHSLSYTEADVDPAILEIPALDQYLRRVGAVPFYHHAPLDLEWELEGRIVGHVNRASYLVWNSKIFVSHLRSKPDDTQFHIVLANYLLKSSHDPEVRLAMEEAEAQHGSLASVYNRFRHRIIDVLRKAYTEREGYRDEHIWRELLQNAENAYASLPDPRPNQCSFLVEVEEAANGTCTFTVSNSGRAFNQPDREGNARDDIARIISIDGERKQTALEIGRYHLGFKSVFTVTDTVTVESGGYKFAVKDLLLRFPAEPERDKTKIGAPTTFRWSCSRAEAAKVVGIAASSPPGTDSRFMKPSYVLFTRFITEVRLAYRGRERSLRLHRAETSEGEDIAILMPDERTVRFRLFRDRLSWGKSGEKEFGVAVMVDGSGLPLPIANDDLVFHVVFPTNHKAWSPFLISADFDLEGHDRSALKNSRLNLTLMLGALRKLFEVARTHIDKERSAAVWVAWAQVLSPMSFWEGAKSFFEDGVSQAEELKNEIRKAMLGRVPHHGRLEQIQYLVVPSKLLRKFQQAHGEALAMGTGDWIDSSLELQVRALDVDTSFNLADWVASLPQDEAVLRGVSEPLHSFEPSGAVEIDELRRARDALARRLTRPEPRRPDWLGADWLVRWWQENLDEEPFTLTGNLFDWVCPEQLPRSASHRAELVRNRLSTPGTEDGKDCWYRVLAHACLISTGRQHSQIVRFLQKLREHEFIERTSAGDFSEVANRIFDTIIHDRHAAINAQGEDAEYWRRVFYDVRKIHTLIFKNELPSVFLELCCEQSRASSLIPFLRSGQLPGQAPWRGVLGQSSLVPLFFVLRELRRLRVIKHDAADPYAFFVCRPVRRAARKLGWISPAAEAQPDVEALLEVSCTIHKKMVEHEGLRSHVLPFFDIPLLALDLSGELETVP